MVNKVMIVMIMMMVIRAIRVMIVLIRVMTGVEMTMIITTIMIIRDDS